MTPGTPNTNPFLTLPSHSSLVPITISQHTYSLFLSISGPPLSSSCNSKLAPLIIIEAGLGVCSSQWPVVARLLSTTHRVLIYDRSGYGRSDDAPSALQLTPETRARELDATLVATGLASLHQKVVLVGHSYGGTLVRKFLLMSLAGEVSVSVAGLVLVDSVTSYKPDMPDSFGLLPGAEGLLYRQVVGLEQHHRFSAEEYAMIEADEARDAQRGTAGREGEHVDACTDEVNAAMGLRRSEGGDGDLTMDRVFAGEERVSVIVGGAAYDFEKIVEFARVHREEYQGDTEEERETYGRALEETERFVNVLKDVEESNKRAGVDLAKEGNGRMVKAEEHARTHNLHYVDPGLVVEEVRWVMAGCKP